jgi:hypothetical protein
MMTRHCPTPVQWKAWLDGETGMREHRSLAAHLRACEGCSETLRRIEPTTVFAGQTSAEAPEGLWEQLWPAVSRVVSAEPRRAPGWFQRLLSPAPRLGWLAPSLACLALVVLWVGFLSGPHPPPAALTAMDAVATDFTNLSNPEAEVSHLLLPDQGRGVIQLTMVVDSRLEEALQ